MTAVEGAVFGVVGALAAFPRRLAARAVEERGGTLRRGVGRGTTHVVLGRTLLARWPEPAIVARAATERAAGRMLLGEAGFLRFLGLVEPTDATGAISRAALLGQSGLAKDDLDHLTLFDAFEHGGEPYSFRDLILARKYARLRAVGAGWSDIARSVHRGGSIASLAAKSLSVGACRSILVDTDAGRSTLDGQLLLDLPRDAEDPEDLFAAGEAAEAEGRPREAAGFYGRCLALDPGDALAAFNRANCRRALGEVDGAAGDYMRAARIDRSFTEAWFNLGCLAAERGATAAARRHLGRALALDPDFADAIYNLAALEFDAGNLTAARDLWLRYLALDPDSEWGRRAARGVAFVDMSRSGGRTG